MDGPWQVRYCTVCGKPIPQINKHGDILSKWAYGQRKGCGSVDCYSDLQSTKRKYEPPPEPEAIDHFIYRPRNVAIG